MRTTLPYHVSPARTELTMCGRFALSKSERIDWAQFGVGRGPALPPHWNLGPGRPIAAVRDAGAGAEVALLTWGLIPYWAKERSIGARLANARAESVHEKPAFRTAFQKRRCLIPADGFYEWQVVVGTARKQPWFVRRHDEGIFALAGLWERWQPAAGDPVESCTVLTTGANALMAPIHGRMPVIIDTALYGEWLSPDTAAERARELLQPWVAAEMEAYRVSLRVNSSAHDDAECLVPLVA